MLTALRSRIAGLLAPGARPESRSFEYGLTPGFGGAGTNNATLAGPAINHRTALSIAAVWNAVNIYSNSIGALDFFIVERDEKGGHRPAVDHPSYDLIHSRPNDISTSMRLRQALVGQVLTHGDGYLEIRWDSRGRYPVALELMDPRDVEPTWTADHRVVYRQRCGGPDLEAEDVIHIAMFGWDGLRGYSPIAIARDTLAIAAAQRVYQSALFGNGLGMQGHVETSAKMTTIQKSEFRDNVNSTHQGAANAGKFGIWDNGARWVQTSFSPQDAELILGCNFSVAEIARIFNLPQHLLGLLEHANFATLEEQNAQFYQQSLLPFLVAIEQEFNNKLFGPIERRRFSVHHDVSTLLRGNSTAQRAQEDADIASGVRSVNEIRIARGYNPLDDPNADKHWIQANNNLVALEDMGKTPPEPAVVTDPDTATEEDPTLKATPEPGEAAREAVRGVLADAVGRMVRRECQAARKAARRPGFDAWPATFYDDHAQAVVQATAAACQLAGAVLGRSVDPAALAFKMTVESKDRLRGLVVSVPPDELPDAVDRACDDWTKHRADAVVESLIGGAQ